MITAILLFAVLLLGGCATPEEPMSTEPPSTISVYREPSPRDSLFPMLLAVDGRPIVQLHPKDEINFQIAPGEHWLAYELGLYQCSTKVQVESGKAYVYRLAQGCVIERQEPPQEALSE